MARKSKKKETEFEKLARLIKIESDDIRADISEVRKEMATKKEMAEGFASIGREMATKDDIAGIRTELRDIKERLTLLEKDSREHSRYSKEIDHAFERIAAIEKHLGMARR